MKLTRRSFFTKAAVAATALPILISPTARRTIPTPKPPGRLMEGDLGFGFAQSKMEGGAVVFDRPTFGWTDWRGIIGA